MYTRNINYLKSQSFFLLGPRGVGKSNWAKSEFTHGQYIDLLKAKTFNELSANPSRLEEMILPSTKWVVIDEIQKLPTLLDEVHRLIEGKKIKFVLTGSSARKIKKQSGNLLAGRALLRNMYPLTAEELGSDFDFKKSLKIGHLPMAYTSTDPEEYLQAYVKTHLKEEVLQEGIVRNVLGFSRFLEAASFSQAQYLNISKVASDASVDRKVTEEYFRIIEDLLVAVRLPTFQKRAVRKTTKHPKFFFYDVGVFLTIRPEGPLDSPEEREGAALETLVFQELRAQNEYKKWGYEFYSWAISQGPDVDLVLYGKNGIIAIEVKRAKRLRGGELKGLDAFKDEYKMARTFLLYGGDEERNIAGHQIVPVEAFIRNPGAYIAR
jgi:predicted AAA+ superfamily ATPase